MIVDTDEIDAHELLELAEVLVDWERRRREDLIARAGDLLDRPTLGFYRQPVDDQRVDHLRKRVAAEIGQVRLLLEAGADVGAFRRDGRLQILESAAAAS